MIKNGSEKKLLNNNQLIGGRMYIALLLIIGMLSFNTTNSMNSSKDKKNKNLFRRSQSWNRTRKHFHSPRAKRKEDKESSSLPCSPRDEENKIKKNPSPHPDKRKEDKESSSLPCPPFFDEEHKDRIERDSTILNTFPTIVYTPSASYTASDTPVPLSPRISPRTSPKTSSGTIECESLEDIQKILTTLAETTVRLQKTVANVTYNQEKIYKVITEDVILNQHAIVTSLNTLGKNQGVILDKISSIDIGHSTVISETTEESEMPEESENTTEELTSTLEEFIKRNEKRKKDRPKLTTSLLKTPRTHTKHKKKPSH